MTAPFKRIIIVGIALILVAGLACAAVVVSGGCSANAADPLGGVKAGAVNTVLDVSGIKGRIDSELRAKAGEIAEEAGIPPAMAEGVVDSLAIEEWQATTLPADAVETGTYAVSTDDLTANVTTYEDPSIVTIDAYGQTVTMEVPDSAQSYVSFIKYLEYLQ